MSNRNKIERFCKKRKFEIVLCQYVKATDAIYGDRFDASYWELIFKFNGDQHEYESYHGYGVNEDVNRMLSYISEDFECPAEQGEVNSNNS